MSETKEEQHEASTRESTQASTEQKKQPLTRQQLTKRWLEVITAVLLGVVAITTAWSGYQAARWSGEQSTKYAQVNALRVKSTLDSTLAGQYRLYDVIIVNNWINAYTQGNMKLANIYKRRFRPELLPAFNAWIATNPFNNPNAPPGPLFMPQYKVSLEVQAKQLEDMAAKTFNEGQIARDQSDAYVRTTVLLAVVLFLGAIADSFKWNEVKVVTLVIAAGMLVFGLYHVFTYPII